MAYYRRAKTAETVTVWAADSAGGNDYVAPAVNFAAPASPSRVVLSRGAGLTGVTTYNQLLVSVWLKSGASGRIAETWTSQFILDYDPLTDKALSLEAYDVDFMGDLLPSVWEAPDAGWHHHLLAYDRNNEAGSLVLLDGVDVTGTTSFINTGDATLVEDDANFIVSPWTVSSGYVGDMADLWIGFGQWLDLTNPANVAKFRDGSGKPVSLGASGATPTGVAPTVFLSGDAASFATNKGTGGGFTVTEGSLTDASTSPSD